MGSFSVSKLYREQFINLIEAPVQIYILKNTFPGLLGRSQTTDLLTVSGHRFVLQSVYL